MSAEVSPMPFKSPRGVKKAALPRATPSPAKKKGKFSIQDRKEVEEINVHTSKDSFQSKIGNLLDTEIKLFAMSNRINAEKAEEPVDLMSFDFDGASKILETQCPNLATFLKTVSGKKEIGMPELTAACILSYSRNIRVNMFQRLMTFLVWKGGLNKDVSFFFVGYANKYDREVQICDVLDGFRLLVY